MINFSQFNRGPAPKVPDDPDKCADRLDVLLDQRNYDEALRTVDAALRRFPRNAMLLYYRSCAYYYANRLPEAINAATASIASDPESPSAYIIRADAYDDLNKNELALADYNRAIEIAPDYTLCYYERAELFRKMNLPEPALNDLEQALKLDPDDLPSLRLRMEINEELQNFSAALEDSDRILKSGRADCYDLLTRVYCKTALNLPPAEILPDAVKATELNLADPEAWFRRGSLEDSLNNFSAAVQSYTRSIELEPTAAAFACRAESLSSLGKKEEALADFNRAVEIDPADLESFAERGTLLASLGRRREALADLDRFLEKNPDDAQALSCRGTVHADLDELEAAKADLERSLAIQPDPETSYRLSGVLNLLGDYSNAAKQCDLALNGVPDDPDYNFWRGVLFLDDGDEKSATLFFRKAIDCADEASLPYFMAEIGRLYKES